MNDTEEVSPNLTSFKGSRFSRRLGKTCPSTRPSGAWRHASCIPWHPKRASCRWLPKRTLSTWQMICWANETKAPRAETSAANGRVWHGLRTRQKVGGKKWCCWWETRHTKRLIRALIRISGGQLLRNTTFPWGSYCRGWTLAWPVINWFVWFHLAPQFVTLKTPRKITFPPLSCTPLFSSSRTWPSPSSNTIFWSSGCGCRPSLE